MKITNKGVIITLIICIIIILFISSKWRSTTFESFNMMAGMENSITKSDFYVILNECVNNVANHEIALNSLDPKYTISSVKVDSDLSDMENIRRLLQVIKKQDNKILQLLPNYLPNKDLDGLMDGSLMSPLAMDLKSKSTYPENPLECDPEAIQRAINGYQNLVNSYPGGDDDSKNKRTMYNSSITQLQSKLVELYASRDAPGNTKCLPKLSPTDAEGLLDGFYANRLCKIIKSQDFAIVAIQNKVQSNIVKFYSAPL